MLATNCLQMLLCLIPMEGGEDLLPAMQQRVKECRVTIAGNEAAPGKYQPEPIFRYSDALRGIDDAGIWIWTVQGRPLAAMKVEYYQPGVHTRRWLYCFASLSPE